jgi:hypothetical protein
MLNRDPPDHTRLRALVSKAFTPRRIEQLRDRVQGVCDDLLSAVASGRSFDLVHGYALPIPLTVIAELLGIPKEDRRRFHALTRGSLALGAPTGALDVPFALPYFWLLSRFFRKLFDERRARPRDDLITALVQAEEAGDRLNEDELLGTAILLLLAGYETTVNLIASGTLALLEQPAERERFTRQLDLAESAIEELLRYTSPVEITPPRVTRVEVTIGSATIRRVRGRGPGIGEPGRIAVRGSRWLGPGARSEPTRRLGAGQPFLPRGEPGADGGANRAHHALPPISRASARGSAGIVALAQDAASARPRGAAAHSLSERQVPFSRRSGCRLSTAGMHRRHVTLTESRHGAALEAVRDAGGGLFSSARASTRCGAARGVRWQFLDRG